MSENVIYCDIMKDSEGDFCFALSDHEDFSETHKIVYTDVPLSVALEFCLLANSNDQRAVRSATNFITQKLMQIQHNRYEFKHEDTGSMTPERMKELHPLYCAH